MNLFTETDRQTDRQWYWEFNGILSVSQYTQYITLSDVALTTLLLSTLAYKTHHKGTAVDGEQQMPLHSKIQQPDSEAHYAMTRTV